MRWICGEERRPRGSSGAARWAEEGRVLCRSARRHRLRKQLGQADAPLHEKARLQKTEQQEQRAEGAHPDEAGGGAGAASEVPPALRSDAPSMVCGSGEPLGICLPLSLRLRKPRRDRLSILLDQRQRLRARLLRP